MPEGNQDHGGVPLAPPVALGASMSFSTSRSVSAHVVEARCLGVLAA
jgi:hypothetical protein